MRLLPHGGGVAGFDLQSYPGHGDEARGHDDRDERFPDREDAANLHIVEVGRVGDGRRQLLVSRSSRFPSVPVPIWAGGSLRLAPGRRPVRVPRNRRRRPSGPSPRNRRDGTVPFPVRGKNRKRRIATGMAPVRRSGSHPQIHRCRHGFLSWFVFRRQWRGWYGDAAATAHGFGRLRRRSSRVEALCLRVVPPVDECRPCVRVFGYEAHPRAPAGVVGHGVQLVGREPGLRIGSPVFLSVLIPRPRPSHPGSCPRVSCTRLRVDR